MPSLRRVSSAHSLANELDEFLGDPMTPGTAFSYRDIVASDELSTFPEKSREILTEWGFHRFLVPVEHGGRLRSLDELFLICRTLSRRNVAVAVMYGATFLATCPVWLWGSPQQQRAVSDELLSGGLACLGLSERDHGSDLRATRTRVEPGAEGLRLTGEKWPVGNAVRGRFVTTFARSGDGQTFSLLLADKSQLPPDTWTTLPPVRTVGLRGHDLSGIDFNGTPIPESAVIGRPGAGLAQVVKTLQITRTATAALSLGTMDAVLRIALRHARERRLYGDSINALPVIRDQLVGGHLDLLIAECTGLPVARALTVAQERMSLWSSIVKYIVPVIAEQTVADMGTVLGARSYLCEGVADGVFQKLQRDHAIAGIFDGTTHVNLSHIAAQLPVIAARCDAAPPPGDSVLPGLFGITESTPDWEPAGRRLRLANGATDDITQAWPGVVEALNRLAAAGKAPAVMSDLTGLTERIDRLRGEFYRSIGPEITPTTTAAQTAAATHCVFHAITSCLLMWLHNREVLDGRFATGEWLVLCLQRLLTRLDPTIEVDDRHRADFARIMLEHGEAGLSLLDLATAP